MLQCNVVSHWLSPYPEWFLLWGARICAQPSNILREIGLWVCLGTNHGFTLNLPTGVPLVLGNGGWGLHSLPFPVNSLRLMMHVRVRASGGRLNIKMSSYQYRDPHVKDKTVLWPSYLQHGNPHTWESWSLYWAKALAITQLRWWLVEEPLPTTVLPDMYIRQAQLLDYYQKHLKYISVMHKILLNLGVRSEFRVLWLHWNLVSI